MLGRTLSKVNTYLRLHITIDAAFDPIRRSMVFWEEDGEFYHGKSPLRASSVPLDSVTVRSLSIPISSDQSQMAMTARTTLQDAVEASENLQYHTIMQDIRGGVEHLHSLGLVHNDINPTNIMVDENGRGVLVDYDSCRPDGEEIPLGCKGGTMGWCPDTDMSERNNDFRGIDKVEEWLRNLSMV
ncbi:kinase domain protein [Ceratobasidium sp. AG-Ba]|nr:kinase domain protein [Ceratobasidium sp. AG-Ba]QRW04769.1 Serine/threonine-protein kinase [Ceratobasidium sp. AG-Ba]